jgi:2-amino-4-hydroxy-6-hydroxymethyldihydropteridine diphosphokinase
MNHHTAFIAVGSNLGDRERNLEESLGYLEQGSNNRLVSRSPLYESEPVGYASQGWFLNGVVALSTPLSPSALLQTCQEIESRLGRDRVVQDGPRTIDLDILFFDDRVMEDPDLVIPHPRLHLRGFVLQPLKDLAPSFLHPKLRKPIHQLLSELEDTHRVRKFMGGTRP